MTAQPVRFLIDADLPRDADATFILRLVESFVQQTALLARLPGRLAIVEPGRVRLRPA
ncbi:MAG: hypothetical protein N3I86_04280 [Verrucomicrobiae bacterium]|nr:hypothetical protein [Verrucomicrobiae bacterium]